MAKQKQDQLLIALLSDNSRLPIAELARKLNVSRTAASARLQRLERDGVIKGYTLKLSDKYLQGRMKAVVMIKSAPLKRVGIERALGSLSELITLYSISGSFDMTAVVLTSSVNELDDVIDQIGMLEGVEETQTSVILSTKIER